MNADERRRRTYQRSSAVCESCFPGKKSWKTFGQVLTMTRTKPTLENKLIITDSGEAPVPSDRSGRTCRFKLCALLCPFVSSVVRKVRRRADFRDPLKAL